MDRVVVVGGGISGLSSAYYLSKAGIPCTLIERRARLGGVIETEVVNGCVLEAGPDSFISIKPAAMELIRELGMADQVIGSNDHLRVTYIRKGGRLVALPDGLMMMVPTKVIPMLTSGLLSWPAKLRMGLEFFRKPPKAPLPDRSVAQFIGDHYGREAVDYLAEPLLAGVYGGDPNQLSVASVLTRFVEIEAKYGSLTRGVLDELRKPKPKGQGGGTMFRTLKGGLQDLVRETTKAIGQAMTRVEGEAETVEPIQGGYRIRVNGEWLEARNVILGCQAYAAGALLAGADGRLAELLASVPYNSSMTLALVYRKAEFGRKLNGFGFLVPKAERRRLVACTWVGTKFSHRVPDEWVVLRCFLGGAGDETVFAESDEALIASVGEELREIMGVTAAPTFHRISRWPRSMAQYTVGHSVRVAEVEARRRQLPGLHLAGNAYYGIGIPDCIRMGKQAAEAIAAGPGQ
ncbi:MAG: protoporphyrinogen oxidase [Acidobacteria bacterium]|nr:protoporphyrinogen oxidase [Acidobacteriota bacterium]